MESTLISEAKKRQKRISNKAQDAQDELEADIADIFQDDAEIMNVSRSSGSKSLMIVPSSVVAEGGNITETNDISEVAKKRKFNSFREKSDSQPKNTDSEPKMVKEFKERKNQADLIAQQPAPSSMEDVKLISKKEKVSQQIKDKVNHSEAQKKSNTNDQDQGKNTKNTLHAHCIVGPFL